MPSRFDAFLNHDEESEEEEEEEEDYTSARNESVTNTHKSTNIPSYEDLSLVRADEEMVLGAVYGDDFRKEGSILNVNIRPPDVESDKIGSELTLSLNMCKKYPYELPIIKLRNVRGLNEKEKTELMSILSERGNECAAAGSVMMCELVQSVEDYILIHNRDPKREKMSAWELHLEQQKAQQEELLKKEKHMQHLLLDDTEETFGIPSVKIENLEVEKELFRQLKALDAASTARHLKNDISVSDNGVGRDDASISSQEDLDFESSNSSSRYKTDFIELDLLGKGGGGEVMKVRNRLDRRYYAIKKIPLFDSSKNDRYANYCAMLNRKLKREVTTISKMTHKNIVRYYQAWVEGGAVIISPQQSKPEQSSEDQIIREHVSYEFASASSHAAGWWELPSDKSSTDFSSQTSSSYDSASQNTPSKSNILHESDIGFQFQSNEETSEQEEKDVESFRNRKPSLSSADEEHSFNSSSFQNPDGNQKLLYIQMEYCSTTLRHLIDDLTVSKMEVKDIFVWVRQILEALAYIHTQKVIHRDLKPSNIFLNSEGNILLGDFGLSRSSSVEHLSSNEIISMARKSHEISPKDSTLSLESLTGGVGTTFYRAPEQEGGRQQSHEKDRSYDVQADIFSFGIVLFEMFHPPFTTYMERANVLAQLRGDNIPTSNQNELLETSVHSFTEVTTDWKLGIANLFPDYFCKNVPENVQKIIIWCLNRSPCKRPLAKTLLSSDLIPVRLELEQLYLKEALRTLANPNSDSYERIVCAIFDQKIREQVDVTFDTDAAIGANKIALQSSAHQILSSSAMSALAMTAASSVLNFDKQLKGGKMHDAELIATSAIAMKDATAAAISGYAGTDPYVMETICKYFTHIFQSHGAVFLKPPLLRPRSCVDAHNHQSGHAEVMNERGNVLMLPDDLTVNFARAVARGGIATVSFKRYDIGTVFHKSLAGGHPRQSTEASFDIVFENNNISVEYVEAEAIMVLCQAMTFIVNTGDIVEGLRPLAIPSPFWYLRITHTKLADSILDLCGVPLKDDLRKQCFQMFTRFCSCPPGEVYRLVNKKSRKYKDKHSTCKNMQNTYNMDSCIENLTSNHNLPLESASRLRIFLLGCLPLTCKIENCLNSIQSSTNKLKSIDIQGEMDSKRSRRYADISKHIQNLRRLIQAMRAMGIFPLIDALAASKTKSPQGDCRVSLPVFISIDFGLRQRRRHMHGQIFFQAVILPEDYFVDVIDTNFEDNEMLLSSQGVGVKVAEGGRFDDLVRKFRPPGNFGSVRFDHYTAAPIPIAIGVRFLIENFIERVYVNTRGNACWNNLSEWINSLGTKVSNKMTADIGKNNLAPNIVRCVIASVNGMDNVSAMEERALVASHLWLSGISAEYIQNSSVFMRMLNHSNLKSGVTGKVSNECSMENLCKVCCILKIPFAIIVQSHLLKDKGAVRLRKIKPTSSTILFSEEFVALSSLATIIKKHLTSISAIDEDDSDGDNDRTILFERQSSSLHKDQETSSHKTPQVDCIYVDGDQYYGMDRLVKGDKGGYKTILKALKATRHKADSFINTLVHPFSSTAGSHTIVIAVDLPFDVIRDFGTWAMKNKQGVTSRAATNDEMAEKYPNHKKVLKTLSFSLDSVIRRRTRSNSKEDPFDDDNSPVPVIYVFLYSAVDDRYDLVTIDVK